MRQKSRAPDTSHQGKPAGVITVMLADDHQIVRQGLRALLETEPDLQIIGEAADGSETVQLVETLQPDILVVDIMMGGMNGIEVTRQISKRATKPKVVVLSMYSNEAYVIEALQAGASGYVLKEATANELVRAIHEAIAGRRYLSSSLSERAIQAYLQKTATTTLDPYDMLSSREREVLHLAVEDHTNAEIAARLFISRRTVEIHRANMMRKLGLSNRVQLIRYAIQRGILPPEK
ncbi:MAG: response regulator transcription factor [Dehalococcoidales bacterium]|nr:response regulator transcription factor [Dehalococcoidales bacterium]